MIMVMSEISGDSFPGKITSFVIHPKSILIEMESWWPKIKLLEIFRKEYVHWVLDGNKPLFKLNEIYVTEF